MATRTGRNYTPHRLCRAASAMCASTRSVNVPHPKHCSPKGTFYLPFSPRRNTHHAPNPTSKESGGPIECSPKSKSAEAAWDAIGFQEVHLIIFFELQFLNKIMTVSLSSISLRSELRANSDEELSYELELHLPQVYRYRLARFADCLLMIKVWRFYVFPPCKVHGWQRARISWPGCKDRLPHWP